MASLVLVVLLLLLLLLVVRRRSSFVVAHARRRASLISTTSTAGTSRWRAIVVVVPRWLISCVNGRSSEGGRGRVAASVLRTCVSTLVLGCDASSTRRVAASCLLPFALHFAFALPFQLALAFAHRPTKRATVGIHLRWRSSGPACCKRGRTAEVAVAMAVRNEIRVHHACRNEAAVVAIDAVASPISCRMGPCAVDREMVLESVGSRHGQAARHHLGRQDRQAHRP